MAFIMFFEFSKGLTDVYIAGKIGKEIQATYGLLIQLHLFLFGQCADRRDSERGLQIIHQGNQGGFLRFVPPELKNHECCKIKPKKN